MSTILNDRAALLEACRQAPDEDTPRLMLADELEAHAEAVEETCRECSEWRYGGEDSD